MSSPNTSGSLDGQQSESDLKVDREISTRLSPPENMKRAAARQLIEQYYSQLTEGCGDVRCHNQDCASSPDFRHRSINRNKLALEAITLSKVKAPLCERRPHKLSRCTQDVGESSSAANSSNSNTTSDRLPVNEIGSVLGPGPGIGPVDPHRGLSDGPTCSTSVPAAGQPQDESEAGSFLVTSSPPDPTPAVLPVSEARPMSGGGLVGQGAKAKVVSPLVDPMCSSIGGSSNSQYLTEASLSLVISDCQAQGSWSRLNRVIGSVFNNSDSIIRSFRKTSPAHTASGSPSTHTSPSPTDGGHDLSVTSPTPAQTDPASPGPSSRLHDSGLHEPDSGLKSPVQESNCGPVTLTDDPASTSDDLTVDLPSLRRAYQRLIDVPDHPFTGALINALVSLAHSVEWDVKYTDVLDQRPDFVNLFIVVMEIPVLHWPEYLDNAFPCVCQAIGALPLAGRARLSRIWAGFSGERLREMVQGLQQMITVKVINGEGRWSSTFQPGDDSAIRSATRVLKLLYYAAVLGGKRDPPELLAREADLRQRESIADHMQGALGLEVKDTAQTGGKEDALATELGVKVIDCREALVPWEDFINEPLNDVINIGQDFTNQNFSFVSYSFILSTASKHTSMYYDNRIRMLNERRSAFFQTLVTGGPPNPFLRVRVRRDHIIDDALVSLEMTAMENPSDLRKQLFVEFDGEQGLDEGGVSKEFFQLIVEELFNPDIGMFTYNEQSGSCWFNSSSFENDAQFTLIGVLLGLAIYNSHILDIHFPMVVYRKLMGKTGTFPDLHDLDPTLMQSLQSMLDYSTDDLEDVFGVTFRIGYQDVFGNPLTYDLKGDGNSIPVTQDNKQEFVELYADFMLNQSIERQFLAFKRGFLMVTADSPLRQNFRPEELEMLVCGSKILDFHALEDATEYDGGFTQDSSTISNFWSVVHAMSDSDKRRLLQFTTGTDRVPVGGLSRLKMIIARNGPDSERLPTSHTCFNVLLLPEYPTVEKMKDRLTKAINYSKGFGML